VRWRWVQRVIHTMRAARRVRGGRRFASRELILAPTVATYLVRRSGLRVFLRHQTRDVAIFTEIFVRGDYEPPNAIDKLLRRTPHPRILDLGANIGLFSVFILGAFPGARLTAIEPDPSNFALLRRCAEANGGTHTWELLEACAGAHQGTVGFAAGLFADSHMLAEPEAGFIEVPVVDLFELAGSTDLLKMDIEGGEWPILADPRLARLKARAVVLEWHASSSPHGDPRGAAIAALSRSGFEIAAVTDPPLPYYGDSGIIWALRP
jgi:FkbM family methyltransferase